MISCILLLTLPLLAPGQTKPAPDYPQDYFRNPLDIPIFLAGNFGECRPGHFHSGVDIKTQGKENLPVHAAAEGYISRIKMEKGGFGHGLYITHPNGYTTLYAHLNDFAPEIQKYVRKEQYAKKRWDVDLSFYPEHFPVKKGQLIAYSGNTGASTAPHLHFEIRNSKTEHPLNPELFGLPVIDNIAPVPAEVVFFLGSEYNDSNLTPLRFFVPVQKKGAVYKPYKVNDKLKFDKDTIELSSASGTIGIGTNVDDYMDGSDNTIAFYTAKLYMDDSLQLDITLDNIGYDETRYINAYADYPSKQLNHKWVQCLFKLPGNHLDNIYTFMNSKSGKLEMRDERPHKIDIVLTDDKYNKSIVRFYLKVTGPFVNIPFGRCTPAGPNNRLFEYNETNIAFAIDDRAMYDEQCLLVSSTPSNGDYSEKFKIGYPWIPLHHYIGLKLKPNKTIPLALRSKVVMMYSDDKDEDGRAAAFGENGWYKAKVRNFGTYWLDIDTTAPTVHGMQKNGANLAKAKQIAIEVKDAVTSVRSYSGYIDGKWVCFEQHGNTCFYKFDEHCGKGKHKLVFKAEDESGNEVVYELSFTR